MKKSPADRAFSTTGAVDQNAYCNPAERAVELMKKLLKGPGRHWAWINSRKLMPAQVGASGVTNAVHPRY